MRKDEWGNEKENILVIVALKISLTSTSGNKKNRVGATKYALSELDVLKFLLCIVTVEFEIFNEMKVAFVLFEFRVYFIVVSYNDGDNNAFKFALISVVFHAFVNIIMLISFIRIAVSLSRIQTWLFIIINSITWVRLGIPEELRE